MRETGEWYEDFIFALQYNEGDYGAIYSYDCVATRNAWVQPGFEKYLSDFAMIRVENPSKTGNFGTHWGWRGQYNEASKIGYPGGVSEGEVIQVEHGPIAFVDGVVQMKHGNQADQGGSSGGAWIGDSRMSRATTIGNYVISVESFGYDEEPGHRLRPLSRRQLQGPLGLRRERLRVEKPHSADDIQGERGQGMSEEKTDMRRPMTSIAAAASTLCIGLFGRCTVGIRKDARVRHRRSGSRQQGTDRAVLDARSYARRQADAEAGDQPRDGIAGGSGRRRHRIGMTGNAGSG